MSSCIVHFDNFQGQFYPGNNVEGRVVCSFTHSKNIREIRLKLRGTEHTSWTGTQQYYDNNTKKTETRTVQYTGHNKFLALQTSLRGSGDIGPGRFEYPFTFVLPNNLPGSYHGKYGWIRFTIKATVDVPFASDYEDEKQFVVVAPIDFNQMINDLDLEPVSYSDEKTLCCCCCASGPITMNVHLEKEAFIPGEYAKVKVEITNMSNENVERVEVKMGMTIESKVTTPGTERRTDYELLAAANDTGVGAHGQRTYEFQVEIPRSTVVPNFNLCTLFKQWAKLKVTGVIPGFHGNLEVSTRIVMGHVPVRGREAFQNANLQPSVFPYPAQQNGQFPSGGMPPPYPAVHQVPYPPTAYPAPVHPTGPPPSSGAIGFAVPAATHSSGFSPGVLPPMAPYSACAPGASPGPSAPAFADQSSAPSKADMEARSDIARMGPSSSLGGVAADLQPPPSYNEAISFPPYPQK